MSTLNKKKKCIVPEFLFKRVLLSIMLLIALVGADLLLIKKDGFSLLNWKLRYQFLVLVDFRSAL